jgi:DNA-3-methyladenine glycosylase
VVNERFDRRWFDRPAPLVAEELIGRELVRTFPSGERRRVRIVETEAYERDDPASHSFRGSSTRTAVMFGPPGHLYVYLIYGIHHCLNVVTGSRGHGAAVLLRAAEPVEGADGMARARGTSDPGSWCSGPAKLAQALEIDLTWNGVDILGDGGSLALWPGRPPGTDAIERGPRVGIGKGRETPWRFVERGSPWASRPRLSPRSVASPR